MVNGKLSRPPLSVVIQMLEGMHAGNIEKIELITNPRRGMMQKAMPA